MIFMLETVRISKIKSVFAKGIFQIGPKRFLVSSVNRKRHPIMYKLKDCDSDIVEGSFYRHEFEPVIHKDDVYLVKNIRTEHRRRESWYLVKWQGYLSSMNSWVRKRDISVVTHRR